MQEHEHQIDCISWAHVEAARTIETSEYCRALLGNSIALEQQPTQQTEEELHEESAVEIQPNTVSEDALKKLSTKERIQQMKINLQAKRDAAKKV